MNILTIKNVEAIQDKIKYKFNNIELLDTAFTHSSTANLYGYESNERLEFFGDSILNFIVSEKLYTNIYNNEGDLSHIRAIMVSAPRLAQTIDKIGLNKYYGINVQVEKMGFPINVKADLFESILGAIYLDGGLENAKKFVCNFMNLSQQALTEELKLSLDAKTRLQQYLQSKGINDFQYKTLSQEGPAHSPTFEIALCIQGEEIVVSKAQSKRSAEQLCAEKALKIMQKKV